MNYAFYFLHTDSTKKCKDIKTMIFKFAQSYTKLFTSEYIYLSFAIFHRQRMANTTVMSKKSFLAIVDDLSWPNLPRVWNSNMKSWPIQWEFFPPCFTYENILDSNSPFQKLFLYRNSVGTYYIVNVDTQKSSICT